MVELAVWGWRKFCAVRHAPKVAARTLVLLAQTDTRVPRTESMRLIAALPQAPLIVEIPETTHQSLPRKVATQHQLAAFLLGTDSTPAGLVGERGLGGVLVHAQRGE